MSMRGNIEVSRNANAATWGAPMAVQSTITMSTPRSSIVIGENPANAVASTSTQARECSRTFSEIWDTSFTVPTWGCTADNVTSRVSPVTRFVYCHAGTSPVPKSGSA